VRPRQLGPHSFQTEKFSERDEDGYYVATVPSLPSCYRQARRLEELAPRIREVRALCLEEQDAPRMKFVALEQVQVSA